MSSLAIADPAVELDPEPRLVVSPWTGRIGYVDSDIEWDAIDWDVFDAVEGVDSWIARWDNGRGAHYHKARRMKWDIVPSTWQDVRQRDGILRPAEYFLPKEIKYPTPETIESFRADALAAIAADLTEEGPINKKYIGTKLSRFNLVVEADAEREEFEAWKAKKTDRLDTEHYMEQSKLALVPKATPEEKKPETGKKPKLPSGHFTETLRSIQNADLPPRLWQADGIFTPGLVWIMAKMKYGKTFLAFQGAHSVGDGIPFIGRKTIQQKVLFVSFELDRNDLHDRTKNMAPLSENVTVEYDWPSGDKGLEWAEEAIVEYSYGMVVFDTFQFCLPTDCDFKTNSYEDSRFYSKWRKLGKKHNTCIVGSWHEGKMERGDYMLNGIGSVGMTANADVIISIDKKRGDTAGKIHCGGNHTADFDIPFIFDKGVFKPSDIEINTEYLSPVDEKIMKFFKEHPAGGSPSDVGVYIGKPANSTRDALNRLTSRGKLTKVNRGIWNAVTLF